MYSRIRLAEKYLRYYLTAANGKGHGIHSPFVYDLVRNVLRDKTAYTAYGKIEELRRRLLRDEAVLEVEDRGAGSGAGASRLRRVADVARHAAKPARLGQLLYRLVRYYQPSVVIELGTSLGLSAAYLAAGMEGDELRAAGDNVQMAGNDAWMTGAKVRTIEGSAAVAERARGHLAGLRLE